MASKNPSYTRSLTDKFAIKGILSEDGKTIQYLDANKDEQTITIDKCLENFRGEAIELQAVIKMNQDLTEEDEED